MSRYVIHKATGSVVSVEVAKEHARLEELVQEAAALLERAANGEDVKKDADWFLRSRKLLQTSDLPAPPTNGNGTV